MLGTRNDANGPRHNKRPCNKNDTKKALAAALRAELLDTLPIAPDQSFQLHETSPRFYVPTVEQLLLLTKEDLLDDLRKMGLAE